MDYIKCLQRTLGWLAHFVNAVDYNTRVIFDASSNPLIAY